MNHQKRHTQAAFGNLLSSDRRDGRVGRDIADLSPLVDAAVTEFSAAVNHRRPGSTRSKATSAPKAKARPWEMPEGTPEEQHVAAEAKLLQTSAFLHNARWN